LSAYELFLHLEVVLDKGLDHLVDSGVAGEAERFGARRLQHLRPAGNDLLDLANRAPTECAKARTGGPTKNAKEGGPKMTSGGATATTKSPLTGKAPYKFESGFLQRRVTSTSAHDPSKALETRRAAQWSRIHDCYCRPAGARAASAEGRYIPREDRKHVTNAHCIADVDDKV
jgi:hypothetical protein